MGSGVGAESCIHSFRAWDYPPPSLGCTSGRDVGYMDHGCSSPKCALVSLCGSAWTKKPTVVSKTIADLLKVKQKLHIILESPEGIKT